PEPVREQESDLRAKILVVDDEEMFADVLVEMLSECGHAVCVARSGPEALEQFREDQFDLVFTDLGMPEMSGWQVAREIKGIQPETPVVLLTGWGTVLDENELEGSVVDMVLSKPVRLEDLSSVVSEALGRIAER
ncbi:MAG TPA: response regulator, partial [Armatimonadota bacterium]|nr:response regulator [Armatimonadota bacterium]